MAFTKSLLACLAVCLLASVVESRVLQQSVLEDVEDIKTDARSNADSLRASLADLKTDIVEKVNTDLISATIANVRSSVADRVQTVKSAVASLNINGFDIDTFGEALKLEITQNVVSKIKASVDNIVSGAKSKVNVDEIKSSMDLEKYTNLASDIKDRVSADIADALNVSTKQSLGSSIAAALKSSVADKTSQFTDGQFAAELTAKISQKVESVLGFSL